MNKERLLRLADFLEKKVAEEKFYMGTWATKEDINTCGTSACAMGWATKIPEFAAEGLHLGKSDHPLGGGPIITPRYAGRAGFAAASTFFDISDRAALWLFSDYEKDVDDGHRIEREEDTPYNAANRIREFVKVDGHFEDACVGD